VQKVAKREYACIQLCDGKEQARHLRKNEECDDMSIVYNQEESKEEEDWRTKMQVQIQIQPAKNIIQSNMCRSSRVPIQVPKV
jgi:hypothetical protein